MADEPAARLDIWLDVACLFKSRSQAQNACALGRVEVNGDRGKPHRLVRPGDRIRISLPAGRWRLFEEVGVADRHPARAAARQLFLDHTPPPTREEIELRRLQRLGAPPQRPAGAGAPKKRERRDLRRLKEGPEE